MNAIKKLIQMKSFWSSVIFGPERKLSAITEVKGYQKLVDDILLWLYELFPIPTESWELINASKNPQSEVFLFRQSNYSNIPEKIFIKRFIIKLENKNEMYWEGLKLESQALKLITEFDDRYQICTPRIYGLNQDLCLMATSYQEGQSFFNVLFESPIKVVIGNSRLGEFIKCLSNLGQWLKEVHSSKPLMPEKDNQVKAILNKDLSGIEMRIDHLEKARPADFPLAVCEKILATSSDLVRRIMQDGPVLQMVHGDFTLSNVLYNSGRLILLDFATFGLGLPEDDLARIYLDFKNVESYSYMFSPEKRGSLVSAFFSGYGREFGTNSNVYEMFYLMKHSIINIYMYTKHWGNRQFLNPFLCRLFYSFQKKFLFELLKKR